MMTKLLFGSMFAAAATALLSTSGCSSSSANQGVTEGDADVDSGPSPGPCPQLQFPATCPNPAPSWKGEVQGLVEKYCGQCHQAGSSASAQLNLSNYADVYANRRPCWYQIEMCWMPNVGGNPAPMAYPTPAERQTLVTWMDVCNAPDN
jgi:hypothetical protein